MHEMTQSVDLLDWFGKFHYAYYHADSTPMYLYSLGQYWRRTGDEISR
jgi:glycogen debranching enzyme